MRRKIVDAESASAQRRLYYRPREVAALTGLGLRTIYEGIYAGRIPSRKIGDARLIPASWLLAQTDAEADDIRQAFAFQHARNSPKNQYSLGNRPRRRESDCVYRNATALARIASHARRFIALKTVLN